MATGLLAAAADADAAVIDAGIGVPLTGITLGASVSASYIEGIPTGDTQALDDLGRLLCGGTRPLGDLPVVGPAIGSAACAVGALDYQFVSRLQTPAGAIVRRHLAVVNVPTLLNVDDDLLPDLVGTFLVVGLDRFTLRVDRVLGEVSTLPLSLEAILDDPTAGSLPRERINVGFDTRASRAPKSWQATAGLSPQANPGLSLDITQNIRGAGSSLTTVGGLFSGHSLNRRNPIGGRLKYTPVPSRSTLGVTLGAYKEIRAGASTPVRVEGSAAIVENARAQRVVVSTSDLPQQLRVRYEEPKPAEGPGAVQRSVTYEASAAVPALSATYTDRSGGSLLAKAIVDATAIPRRMEIKQTGERSGTFQATGGAVGSVEAGFANGEPRLLDVDHPYARIVGGGSLHSFAGRIDALQSVSVDATAKLTASVRLAGDARKPFRALVETPGRTIDGIVSETPREMSVAYDSEAGKIDYDASAGVDQIDATMTSATPIFGRVKRIVARVRRLPAAVSIGFKPATGSGVSFSATQPVGMIEGALTDGRETYPTLPGGRSGAIMRSVPDEFSLFVRLFEVTGGSFTTAGPRIEASVSTTPLANGDLQDLDFDVIFDVADDAVTEPARVLGHVDDMPSKLELVQAGTHTDYTASGRVPLMTFSVENLPGGQPGEQVPNTNLHAMLRDVPTRVTASVAGTEQVVFDAAGGKLGLAEVRLAKGRPSDDVLPGEVDGVLVREKLRHPAPDATAGEFDRSVTHVRIHDLFSAEVVLPPPGVSAPLHAEVDSATSRDVRVDSSRDRFVRGTPASCPGRPDPDGCEDPIPGIPARLREEYTRATLQGLQRNTELHLDSSTGETNIAYSADGEATRLDIDTNATGSVNLHADAAPLGRLLLVCVRNRGRACGIDAFELEPDGEPNGPTVTASTAEPSDQANPTRLNLIDCKRRGFNGGCTKHDEGAILTQLEDFIVGALALQVHSPTDNYDRIYITTDPRGLRGRLAILDPHGEKIKRITATFPSGFGAGDRRVLIGRNLIGFPTQRDRSGTITCPPGTTLEVIAEIHSIEIPALNAGHLCDNPNG